MLSSSAASFRLLACAPLLLVLAGCAGSPPREPLAAWIDRSSVPLAAAAPDFAPFAPALDGVRVIGLGEATHGQRESFERKRELTMHLIAQHGVRLVAYEASATRALACDAYVQGESDDLDAAMKGFGMLIWSIEENAQLLRDLRAWNARARPEERVRFVGIDVQDPGAAAARIEELAAEEPELGAHAQAIAERLNPAVQKLWSGDNADYLALLAEVRGLAERIESWSAADASRPRELARRAQELRWAVEAFFSPGGRDRAMAEMLLAALVEAGPAARAVLWAHNGHVQRGPLRYLGSEDLAMGGHLGAALGAQYYALGFLFGEGEFQANDRDAQGQWGFRRYAVAAPPQGALEEPFVAHGRGDLLIDLRGAPRDGTVGAWLDAGHGQRWYGGYNIAANYAELARDTKTLLPTFPRVDFDGLCFLARTRAATPRGLRVLDSP
ncbi:MAG: erythromycin esterase family protein [Planctomycetes bacterium]|nr:erythromycin esterase family protein [Planctomycetota bacterium]